MKLLIANSFEKDFRRVRDPALEKRIRAAIQEVQEAKGLTDLAQIKKLAGSGNYWRIRVGEYRIGAKLQSDTLVFVRVLNRKEIYRRFPPT